MPWFKVDDNLAFHAKTMLAGNAAMGLWVRAGSWSSQQLTDGHIPSHIIAALGTHAQAGKLVSSGLWDFAEGGYQFHQWTERQPNSAAVKAERFAARERMADLRAKKKGVKKASPQVSDSGSDEQPRTFDRSSENVQESFALPDPVPVPVPTQSRPKTNTSASAERDFEKFWDAYGKKTARADALRAFKKALKKTDAETLIRAAEEHLAWHHLPGNDPKFLPHASKWLNGERWNDERAARRPAAAPISKAEERMRANLAVVAELEAMEQQQQPNLRAIGRNQ
jgi:hypothetical protein